MNYPYNLNREEVIRQITKVYHAGYGLNNPNFDIHDQLLACEAIDESQKEYEEKNTNNPHKSVSVSGNGNGSYKLSGKIELTTEKQNAIRELNKCNYKTPIYKLASLLEQLFLESRSKQGHWNYIAERYFPKTINSILYNMTKQYGSDWKNLNNPAAYFTKVIKFRPKRKTYQEILKN